MGVKRKGYEVDQGETCGVPCNLVDSLEPAGGRAFGPADNKSSRAVLVLAAAIIRIIPQTFKIAYTALSCPHASRPIILL